MVLQVQTHLGATGPVNTKYLAWKKKAAADCKWDHVEEPRESEVSLHLKYHFGFADGYFAVGR